MNELTFLLLFAAGLTQYFVITASQGGNRSVKLFYCKIPGCAANVTLVYCNDKPLPTHTRITSCAGPPPPNTVCQHDGRAFVSSDTDGDCEFEGKGGYIRTKKCTDHSIICTSINSTTSKNVTTEEMLEDHLTYAYMCIGGVVSFIQSISQGQSGASLLIDSCFCKKRLTAKNQQPASDSGVTEPLRDMQSLGETNGSDTRSGGPGLDGGSAPSQCDWRV